MRFGATTGVPGPMKTCAIDEIRACAPCAGVTHSGGTPEPPRQAVAEVGEQPLRVERRVEDLGGGGLEHLPRRLEAILVPVQRLELARWCSCLSESLLGPGS